MYTSKKLRELTETPSILGNAVSATLHGLRQEDLLKLIAAYANFTGTDDMRGLAERLLRALGEILIQEEPTDEQTKLIDRASKELQKSHRQFRAVLAWLCSPKDSDVARSPSLKQLESGKVEWGRYPLIDKTSEGFVRYLENHGLSHFRSRLSLQDRRLLLVPRLAHFVDLFCACILDRCLARESAEMPIKRCPRCHRFFASQRRTFCSKECQWAHYWTPERRSDDKWIKDLEKFSELCRPKYGRSIEDLRKRLALPKTRQRLEAIRKRIAEEDWAGWSNVARRLEAIEQRSKGRLPKPL